MIARLLAWYIERSRREQVLIAVAAILAVVALFFLIAVPITDSLAAARSRYGDAVIAQGETQVRVDAIKAVRAAHAVPLDTPLDAAIRARADAAGFTLTNVAPQGSDRVQITIGSARPGALLGWISELEEAGILVDTLGTTDNGDRTVATTMTLKSRGV